MQQLATLLESAKDYTAAGEFLKALRGKDEELRVFLVSDALWGGHGSIAHRCMPGNNEGNSRFRALMVKLGKLQLAAGISNPRTEDRTIGFGG